MNVYTHLPTRCELVGEATVGAVVARAAGFGAAKLFPSEATVPTDGELNGLADDGAIRQ